MQLATKLAGRPAATRPALVSPCNAAAGRHRLTVRASFSRGGQNFSCPYQALGVSPTSTETDIKRAYRKLAKQLHPDVNNSPDAHVQFLNVAEAYEFLISLSHKDLTSEQREGNSAAFKEWYWQFRMARTWERQQQGHGPSPTAAASPKPQNEEGLRTQLAGLRHRAAMRKQKGATATSSASDASDGSMSMDGQEQQEGHHHHDQQQQQHAVHAEAAHSHAAYASGDWSNGSLEDPMLFVAADGPSDSACGSGMIFGSQAAGAAGEAAHQQHLDHPEEQNPFSTHAGSRRKFVANTEVRNGLKEQLHGMKRKAMLKQQHMGQQTMHQY